MAAAFCRRATDTRFHQNWFWRNYEAGIFLASVVCALLIGCSKQSDISPQGTAAGSQSSTSAAKDEKNQVDSAAKEAERQVASDAAKAQKDKIQAEAKAAKSEIDAKKADAEAATKQAEKNVNEQSQRIQQAVGSAEQSISGQQRDEQQILQKARDAAKQTQGVDVTVDSGTVTLRGNVNSQQEKDDVENRVKQATGDQNVKNEIKVNDNGNNTSQRQSQPAQPSNEQK